MKKLHIVALLLAATISVAQPQESVESMKSRVDAASEKDQVDLCTRIAERQLQALDKAYNDGNQEAAKAALQDVGTYGVKATDAARNTGKRMKQTEIAMRKIAARLEDIRKTLDVDDRPAVGEVVQRLEKARTELLNRMFRK
jgi:intergrase/recombinase